MEKEKFDRSKPHINIGDIEKIKNASSTITTKAAFQFASESYQNYSQTVLKDLVQQYGEEEGNRRFELLKQASQERYNDFQNIDSTPEEREDSVNISRRR